MPFSKEDLHMRKGLRESKNYSSRQFLQEFPEKHWTRSCSVLFSAILVSRVGRIMNNIPPASSVFRQSYQFLHCQSSPFLYVAQPVCSRFPLFRFPGIVPCMMSFSKHIPSLLMMCPK